MTRSIFVVFSIVLTSIAAHSNVIPGLVPNEWSEQFLKLYWQTNVRQLKEPAKLTNGSNLQRATFKTPFYNDRQKYWFSVTDVQRISFENDLESIGTPYQVPDHFYRINSGVGYMNRENNPWGFYAALDSFSDRPFQSLKTTNVNLTAFYLTDNDYEKSRWLYLINYASLQIFAGGMPLPGFAYIHRPFKGFIGLYGMPFSMVNWIDFPKFQFFAQFSPFGSSIRYARGVFGPFQVYASITNSFDTIALQSRVVADERLFFEQVRQEVGVFAPVSKKLFFELAYIFNSSRSVYVGEEFLVNKYNRLRLQPQETIELYMKKTF